MAFYVSGQLLTEDYYIANQNKQLEDANQFKDKVLALVAHDLRAPLITSAMSGLTRKINFLVEKTGCLVIGEVL